MRDESERAENLGQIKSLRERENFILIVLIKSKSCKLIIRFVGG